MWGWRPQAVGVSSESCGHGTEHVSALTQAGLAWRRCFRWGLRGPRWLSQAQEYKFQISSLPWRRRGYSSLRCPEEEKLPSRRSIEKGDQTEEVELGYF